MIWSSVKHFYIQVVLIFVLETNKEIIQRRGDWLVPHPPWAGGQGGETVVTDTRKSTANNRETWPFLQNRNTSTLCFYVVCLTIHPGLTITRTDLNKFVDWYFDGRWVFSKLILQYFHIFLQTQNLSRYLQWSLSVATLFSVITRHERILIWYNFEGEFLCKCRLINDIPYIDKSWGYEFWENVQLPYSVPSF